MPQRRAADSCQARRRPEGWPALPARSRVPCQALALTQRRQPRQACPTAVARPQQRRHPSAETRLAGGAPSPPAASTSLAGRQRSNGSAIPPVLGRPLESAGQLEPRRRPWCPATRHARVRMTCVCKRSVQLRHVVARATTAARYAPEPCPRLLRSRHLRPNGGRSAWRCRTAPARAQRAAAASSAPLPRGAAAPL